MHGLQLSLPRSARKDRRPETPDRWRRAPRFALAAVAGGLLAIGAGAGPAFASAHSTSAGRQSKVGGFNGTYTGTSYRYTDLTDPSLMMSPARLGRTGSATFSVTVTSDQGAALWNTTTAELEIAGLRPAGHGRDRTLTAAQSMVYAQDNSMGTGYCANDQFLSSGGTFVFGADASCFVHSTPPLGSTETFSVTITGMNTFTDTVMVPDTNNNVGAHNGFICAATVCTATYSGDLTAPPQTEYYPALYLLPGRTTPGRTAPWTFTVANASYTRTVVGR